MDGNAFAKEIRSDLKKQVISLSKPVGLGTILVGEDPGSVAYVDGKHRDCAEVGIKSIKLNLPATASTDEIISAVNKLNNDPLCTGFIVQLPLPSSVDAQKVLAAINPLKDADGLTPSNLGNLVLGFKTITPCTPLAILALLESYKVNISGQKVLIIGRGTTVGRPLSILLSQKPHNATVTLAHSVTKNLTQLVQSADVVISAIGSAHLLKPEMFKRGAVAVDVGITRVGNQLLGDIDPSVIKVASLFAPMPGGIGPVTRVMLLKNLLRLAKNER
jgi:methylenetetrahydrofolate dehydrogenase (NADP+)/methenyltetrahydrofolate cyclohydrolase